MKQEKLTLRLDGELIEKAKRVARERETSVSGMVAGFFDSLEGQHKSEVRVRGPITSRLRGSLRAEDGASGADEDGYRRYLAGKHA